MNMHLLDWAIIGGILLVLLVIAVITQRLNRSVADFLVANRCAGRYLLTMADGMAGLGAITIAADFEKFYESGFGGLWWGNILAPVALVLSLTGFVVYRYRETRVLTMAEFFERRYSRNFRIYSGMLAFVSGVVNYGIFPAVTARFIIYFTGLPPSWDLLGLTIPMMPLVMLILLSTAIAVTLSGGQISVMITDFISGQLINLTMLVVLAVLLTTISWTELMSGLEIADSGRSKINPFQQGNLPDFNPMYFLMAAVIQIYGYRAWQGGQGYNGAAKTPHEAKMANILAAFRAMVTGLLILLLPIFVFAVLHLEAYADVQAAVAQRLEQLGGDEHLQSQMRVPTTLGQLLPVGVMGLFASVIILAAISTDDTYLHSWGSIFIQDVVMPFRNKPLSPKTHMRLLRAAILGVAMFAFFFSCFFTLYDYIRMWFLITGAIFLGGAGVVILGGLYWKRGTVEGAWAAMIIGPILAITGIVLQNMVWPWVIMPLHATHPDAAIFDWLPHRFPLNGVKMTFVVMIVCVTVYVTRSLRSGRPPVDMDKLLNRGRYAIEHRGHHPAVPADALRAAPSADSQPVARSSFWSRLLKRLGMTEEFTRGDKMIFALKFTLFLIFFSVFVVVTPLHFLLSALGYDTPFDDEFFKGWWFFRITFIIVLGLITTVWFLIGGFRDLFDLIHTLRTAARDETDDGSVTGPEHLQDGA